MTRPPPNERPTIAELRGQKPVQVAGQPAAVCPHCGAGMFVDGVNRTEREIVRYVVCRNKKCGRRFVSYQQPAKLLREITDGDDSAGGKPALTLVREVG